MDRSLQTRNPLIVSDFHAALLHQLLLVLALLALCAVGFNVARTLQYRRLKVDGEASYPSLSPTGPEPAARRALRVAFGCLWVFDGLLQLQSSMPLGLPSGVIEPSASTSPTWVQHLVNNGITIWSDHPIEAAAATVWIQVGLGLWLLVAPRGRWSRFGGAASVAWGLLVWAFGESFGGILAPGLTWLYGAPGAVLFYCAAGVLLALPESAYSTRRLGRVVLAGSGVFLIGMAALQAWPGRGYWQGHNGTLSTMVQNMARTPQPGVLSSWLTAFASFDAGHGWAVNLFVVLVLAAGGVLLLTGRPRLVLGALGALTVLCLADWVLVEDLGFLGGLGTDPNSMLPMALFFWSGYLALTRVPAGVAAGSAAAGPDTSGAGRPHWWQTASLGYLARVTAAVAALAVVVVGAAPMSLAAADRTPDSVLTEAVNGSPNSLDEPAPPFDLTDQHGQDISLSALRGHVVALTFLDPVCTTDCPLIAQEFKRTDQELSGHGSLVDFVAIVANPIYRSASYTRAFDEQEGLTGLRNWYFLTGSLSQLQSVWNSYGILVQALPAGAMIAHSDLAFVIDTRGRDRDALIDDPGPTQATATSFSVLLEGRIDQVLNS